MRLEVFLSRRLSLRNNSGDKLSKATSPGVKIAVTGIALSFIIMLFSIAVVRGFKDEIRKKVTGFEQQITLMETKDYGDHSQNEGIKLDDNLKMAIKEIAPEGNPVLTFYQPAMLKTDDNFEGILIKGLSSDNDDINFIGENIVSGKMPHFGDSTDINPLVISQRIANSLNLTVGDDVMAHFFAGDNLLSRKMKIEGIYDTHFGDYDKMYCFSSIEMLQRLNRTDSLTGTAININGLNPEEIDDITDALRRRLFVYSTEKADGSFFSIQNVNMAGAVYFNWLSLLDTNVVVILILMGCVSGFTLISSLFIIVLQRVSTIGLLKALGATNIQIRKIFILMAAKVLGIGLIVGNIIGLGIIWLQASEKIIPLDADAYYLNYVPVAVDTETVLILNGAIILISFILLIIPSLIVSHLSPAETMRYE
ncbi:MAG: ABC transporter permease [Paramuribaculum sp.]|nr:ABC transporter permease [Paramuribaculum sp.]